MNLTIYVTPVNPTNGAGGPRTLDLYILRNIKYIDPRDFAITTSIETD